MSLRKDHCLEEGQVREDAHGILRHFPPNAFCLAFRLSSLSSSLSLSWSVCFVGAGLPGRPNWTASTRVYLILSYLMPQSGGGAVPGPILVGPPGQQPSRGIDV